MFSKKNIAIGLLAFVFTTPAILAGNPGGTTNNTKGGSAEGTAQDTKAISQSADGKGLEATPTASGAGLSDAQLEKKIAEVLDKNPQLIVQALQNFQQKQMHIQEEKIKASLMKYKDEIAKDTGAVVLGKKDAEVKLVVFLDANCPHCRPFSVALHKARENFPNLAILIRHWPILGKDSEDVARGLWAIKQQGDDKFAAATQAIATSEEKFTYAKLLSWVKNNNLNVKKFEEDANSQATKDVIEGTKTLASNIGFEGTPTSILVEGNTVRLVMPTDEKSLEAILKGAGKGGPAKA
jgi:protein-disulfide isomerase